MTGVIAFQGRPGAYSDLACRNAYPDMTTLPCHTFDAAMEAVRSGAADLAMIATENSLAGRVPDVHSLLPQSGLFVVGEAFQRVEHCLLAIKGATEAGLKTAHSHAVALGQVRQVLAELNLTSVVESDTAGSAELLAQWQDPTKCAIASSLAGELFGLEILRRNIEDAAHNTTRFFVMARAPADFAPGTPGLMTTFIFRVRNVPAALYKALGGFATNGVNMTKLESYMVDGHFSATQFLCDVEGHPEDPGLRRALEELTFFSRETKILGVYPAAAFRKTQGTGD
jgi:prephenate dehydratase